MTILFEYPAAAFFGRSIPKSKIYEHAAPNSSIRDLFVRQLDKIIWEYKLAPETINLQSTRCVPEIQVFRLILKNQDLKHDVIRYIDKAIPFPIMFETVYDGQVKGVAAYKRPNETNHSQWVISEYFESHWMPCETDREKLPVVFDLEALYKHLIRKLAPFPAHADETLNDHVQRIEQIKLKQKEIERCEARLKKEKQFNRKVEINSELRRLKQDMELLTAVHDTP